MDRPPVKELQASRFRSLRPPAGQLIKQNMHILSYKITFNSWFWFYLSRDHIEACSSWTWKPIQKILKLGKIYHIRMILSLITYPLNSKIKPIITVYANVSKLPSPPGWRNYNWFFSPLFWAYLFTVPYFISDFEVELLITKTFFQLYHYRPFYLIPINYNKAISKLESAMSYIDKIQ